MGKIKNVAVKKAVDYLVSVYGPGSLGRVLAHLPKEKHNFFTNTAARAWVSIEDYQDFLEAVSIEFFDEERDELRALGAHRVEGSFNGFGRFFRFTGPKAIVRAVSYYCQLNMNLRGIEIVDSGHNHLDLHIPGDGGDHPLFWEELSGALGKSVEISGGKDVGVSWSVSPFDRHKDLLYRITWS